MTANHKRMFDVSQSKTNYTDTDAVSVAYNNKCNIK